MNFDKGSVRLMRSFFENLCIGPITIWKAHPQRCIYYKGSVAVMFLLYAAARVFLILAAGRFLLSARFLQGKPCVRAGRAQMEAATVENFKLAMEKIP
ncbi:hypothetical protein [Pseudomonas syringae]|uniref:hypothetical protein n=1 Tax=Pseudomonas syringae TaxID=317 RepID=UPI000467C855|nr:hypothetical protein [Pseudomonas syringae]